MTSIVKIEVPPGVKTMGLRSSATPYAEALHKALSEHQTVSLDFASIEVTQGFVDGLLGSHLLKEGKEGLKRITFLNCTTETKAIIRFVASDRLNQRNAQPAP
ncbi:STAS-like domain-containing protein [Pseudomonas sp. PLMAX]|uniref:STAS-like domain-containing protein n=1 Tax=Pseudomonas sp. PLMAX TaxID=2201998 RepID=UPI0038BD2F90